MNRFGLLILISAVLVFSSCVSTGPAATSSGQNQPEEQELSPTGQVLSASPVYFSSGEGSSQSAAFNSAKLEVIKMAASDALGISAASANRDKLEKSIYLPANANALVYNDTMEVIDRKSEGNSTTVIIGIRVNLEALAGLLRANDIIGGKVLPQGGTVLLPDMERPAFAPAETVELPEETAGAAEAVETVIEEPEEPVPSEVTAEEIAIIDGIVRNLTYMVYYDDESGIDPFLAKTAVGMANRYLSQNSMEYVDLDQIERIKEDQAHAYEEETGESVSMIQWIAGKLNADIYIEIVLDANSSTKNGRYYGSATVNLKNFDASTGAGRGAGYYQTIPPAMSTVSEADALNNAVASATFNAVSKAVEQAREYTRKELSQGIKYDLVIQNTYDARLMRDFMKKLERKVKSIKRVSTSPEETKYEVRLIGGIEDLEDLIYDVSENLPGLEGMALVYQRGNSITFDSGL